MGEAVVDQESFVVLFFGTLSEVVEDLFAVPSATAFCRSAAFGLVVSAGKLLVGGLVRITAFAGAHVVITCTINYRGHSIIGDICRRQFGIVGIRIQGSRLIVGQTPDSPARHDHMT